MPFELFDRHEDYQVIWRHLPHWEQPGATYFITWRTFDSMPKPVLREWIAERDEWLHRHGLARSPLGAGENEAAARIQIPPALQAAYNIFIAQRWESRLDQCHGECWLSRPDLARVVADSLRHFDGSRYALGDFVVMPNHVHLLVSFPGEGQLLAQCRSWKKFTATQINKALKRRGELWQTESFDHLIRTVEEFGYYRQYIADNPLRAGLAPGTFVYYRAPDPAKS